MNVMAARKKYDVKYPALYAPSGHKHETDFNCVPRTHASPTSAHECDGLGFAALACLSRSRARVGAGLFSTRRAVLWPPRLLRQACNERTRTRSKTILPSCCKWFSPASCIRSLRLRLAPPGSWAVQSMATDMRQATLTPECRVA